MADEIEYEYGSISAAELESELQAFVDEYRAGGTARKEAEAAGLDRLDEDVIGAISFSERRAGLDPATATVIVAMMPTVKHIVTTFWDQVLLPRLRRRYGDDVLGKEKRRG